MRWLMNRILASFIRRERKRQYKHEGYSWDSDQRKGTMNLILIARQYHARGKYVQALALLEAATEVYETDVTRTS